jgi:hypothetical protein
VFLTGTGFAPISTVNLSSSAQGSLLPSASDVQGQFTTTYVDTHCTGGSETVTGTDSAGNTASVTFTCG